MNQLGKPSRNLSQEQLSQPQHNETQQNESSIALIIGFIAAIALVFVWLQ